MFKHENIEDMNNKTSKSSNEIRGTPNRKHAPDKIKEAVKLSDVKFFVSWSKQEIAVKYAEMAYSKRYSKELKKLRY